MALRPETLKMFSFKSSWAENFAKTNNKNTRKKRKMSLRMFKHRFYNISHSYNLKLGVKRWQNNNKDPNISGAYLRMGYLENDVINHETSSS